MAVAAILVSACADRAGNQQVAQWNIVGQYCTECHNRIEVAGGLSLAGIGPEHIAEAPETWERVVRKLRGDIMPPPGGPRPSADEMAEFIAALERRLDDAAAERGQAPGRIVAHRLNRTEYAAAVDGLLGIRIDPASMLPAEVSSDGFDNVAEVLGMSPTHLDRYITAARDISRLAVGEPHAAPSHAEYRPQRENWTTHVDGLPLGTRGGMLVEHYFPSDGEYVISIEVASVPAADLRAYPHGWLDYRHRLILTVDGQKVFEGELGGEDDLRAMDQEQIAAVEAIKDRFRGIRVGVRAGHRQIGATFVARSRAESDYRLHSMVPGEGVPDVPRMHALEVVGPYNPAGISEPTRSRERIFSCYPENEQQAAPCARQILTDLARTAFRGTATESDIERLMTFYRAGSDSGGFEAGIQQGLMAILASTRFLYRVEPGGAPAGIEPGQAYPVDELELAWRLAFFLWSQGPDRQLLDLAEQGRLSEPDVYQRQIRRMLADPKSKSLITNFAFQWLDVRRLDVIAPDPKLYPMFDEDLRDAFRRELELFLDSILRTPDTSVLDVLTANHTFLNERLARHYEVGSVRGDHFRRVALEDPRRFGLFGKGSVLMVTSYPDRTSPVLRGDWILKHILATPPSPVPAGVETNLDQEAGEQPRSVRERLERHRTQPSCSSCHSVIDPLGQALENFGPIGEWRAIEIDTGVPVDPRGQLASGIAVAGPEDLRAALVSRPELFVQALTENLLIYALGRSIDYNDMPVVRAIVREAAEDNYSFASIVMGIAQSIPFRMRAAPEVATEATVVAAGGDNGYPAIPGGGN